MRTLRPLTVLPPEANLEIEPQFIQQSGCEGKLGVALESLQGLRDLT